MLKKTLFLILLFITAPISLGAGENFTHHRHHNHINIPQERFIDKEYGSHDEIVVTSDVVDPNLFNLYKSEHHSGERMRHELPLRR